MEKTFAVDSATLDDAIRGLAIRKGQLEEETKEIGDKLSSLCRLRTGFDVPVNVKEALDRFKGAVKTFKANSATHAWESVDPVTGEVQETGNVSTKVNRWTPEKRKEQARKMRANWKKRKEIAAAPRKRIRKAA